MTKDVDGKRLIYFLDFAPTLFNSVKVNFYNLVNRVGH